MHCLIARLIDRSYSHVLLKGSPPHRLFLFSEPRLPHSLRDLMTGYGRRRAVRTLLQLIKGSRPFCTSPRPDSPRTSICIIAVLYSRTPGTTHVESIASAVSSKGRAMKLAGPRRSYTGGSVDVVGRIRHHCYRDIYCLALTPPLDEGALYRT